MLKCTISECTKFIAHNSRPSIHPSGWHPLAHSPSYPREETKKPAVSHSPFIEIPQVTPACKGGKKGESPRGGRIATFGGGTTDDCWLLPTVGIRVYPHGWTKMDRKCAARLGRPNMYIMWNKPINFRSFSIMAVKIPKFHVQALEITNLQSSNKNFSLPPIGKSSKYYYILISAGMADCAITPLVKTFEWLLAVCLMMKSNAHKSTSSLTEYFRGGAADVRVRPSFLLPNDPEFASK